MQFEISLIRLILNIKSKMVESIFIFLTSKLGTQRISKRLLRGTPPRLKLEMTFGSHSLMCWNSSDWWNNWNQISFENSGTLSHRKVNSKTSLNDPLAMTLIDSHLIYLRLLLMNSSSQSKDQMDDQLKESTGKNFWVKLNDD